MSVMRKGKSFSAVGWGDTQLLTPNCIFKMMVAGETLHSFLLTGFQNGKKDFIENKGHQEDGTETSLILMFLGQSIST